VKILAFISVLSKYTRMNIIGNADKSVISDFICEKLLNNRSIESDENLLLSGLLDSLGIVKLMLFLEEKFSITIPPQDVTITNMASVDAIVGYLDKRPDHP